MYKPPIDITIDNFFNGLTIVLSPKVIWVHLWLVDGEFEILPLMKLMLQNLPLIPH
uniref:Uncharacterized protein n=1 Tax=Arundo donax TaxID=35708 RepID=A0A0A8ZSF5_ARUDO